MTSIAIPRDAKALRLFLLGHSDKLEHGARQGLYRFADADRIHQVADAALEKAACLIEFRQDLNFETLDKLRAFLYRVAVHVALDHHDRLTREQNRTRPFVEALGVTAVSSLDIALSSELRMILARALEQLATDDPQAHHVVVEWSIGGCSPGDLAQRLGISLQKLNARLASGCRRLAPILGQMGYYRETL